MTKHSLPVNRRILIIDDNRDIHGDFRKVIGGGHDEGAALAAAELAILGEISAASDALARGAPNTISGVSFQSLKAPSASL